MILFVKEIIIKIDIPFYSFYKIGLFVFFASNEKKVNIFTIPNQGIVQELFLFGVI